MNKREIKFELIWDSTTIKRVVTLDEINEMGEEYKSVAYIRQFTGLKDKNGKEIYEGDIVKGFENMEAVEVKMDLGNYGWFPFVNEFPLLNVETIPRHCKVIGNIYENKELLA